MLLTRQDSSCNLLDIHCPYYSGYASRLLAYIFDLGTDDFLFAHMQILMIKHFAFNLYAASQIQALS